MSRTKDDNLRDQVSGLKHMVQELQKENSTYGSKIRSLENENKVLTNETEDLKGAIRTLESAVDESIEREERMLEEEKNLGDDPASMDRLLRETRLELDQVRKKLSDTEKKNSRTIAELNKEVGDLESLVEAKIYREDDLEREVEKLKDKVQRLQSKSSKSGGERDTLKSSTRGSHTRSSTVTQQTVTQEDTSGLVCEICEQHGHDIFSCPLLKDDENAGAQNTDGDLYCIDCESPGHTCK
jgi:CAP-Gly domain-containing linker protein 1